MSLAIPQTSTPIPAGSNGTSRPRPMLARDADAIYWMARYIERAEHIARLLLINSNVLIDVGDLDAELQERLWQSILTILRLPELPTDAKDSPQSLAQRIARHLTFDTLNRSSILNCLTRARENARGIRENISAEMWEQLNVFYLSLKSDDAKTRFEESPDDLYRAIATGSMLFQGITDQTLPHDQRWHFAQLAKYLERIDVTCRVLETRFDILHGFEQMMDGSIRNLHLMSVLRCCCSIEAYRRSHVGDLDPIRVTGFLILQKDFPRSVRYCVSGALASVSEIRAATRGGMDPAERILGRLEAQLAYTEIGEILSMGVIQYLQQIQSGIIETAKAVQESYFPH